MEMGRLLAGLMQSGDVRCLCLAGTLGCGKTTLVRGFVSAFPGGEKAEVASPSFTLCNIYPTRPEIVHADLYRLNDASPLPEEAEDAWEEGGLLILEWPERAERLPKERLELHLEELSQERAEKLDNSEKTWKSHRLATFEAFGSCAQGLLLNAVATLKRRFPSAQY